MKISIIQSDLFWENREANLEKLGSMISPVFGKTDLVILPEMFSTGFSDNALKLSEPQDSFTHRWLHGMAKKGNFGICGSYITAENGKFYNRLVFIAPDGSTWTYDKRHLFSPGNENKTYTPGKSRIVLNFREVRILPSICYDLRFPVWTRNRNDYDLLINSASWPESRRDAWLALLKARAVENQCYVAAANRVGTDGNGISHCGESVIYSPKGELIAFGNPNEECVVSGDISMTELRDFREKFPVMNDADDFRIIV
jgi:predicted amidohydrolase